MRVKLFKTSVINSFQVLPWRVNRLPTFWSPFPSMKSFFFASALMVLAHPAPADVFAEIDTPNPLIGIASVEESPLVLVGFAPDSGAQETDSELQDLRQDLREAEARLQETRRTAEAVVEERDEAREEVGALTMANHRMLMEIRMLQKEKEQARQEAVVWKARAEESMKQASALDEAGVEMIGLKEEFHALRQDLVRVREELKDPIERASLREQLVAARAHGERLEKEIAAALKSGEEARRVASREKREMTAKIMDLSSGAGSSDQLRDDLRISRAGHLKALVDVELLKKNLGRASQREERALTALRQAERGVEAVQAEKAAVAQSRMQVQRDRDEARKEVDDLRKQIAKMRSEGEQSRASVARLNTELANSRSSHGQALRLAGPAADEARGEGVHLASPGELGGMERGQETPRDAAGNRVSDPEDP